MVLVSHSLENAGIDPRLSHVYLLPNNFQFIIYLSSRHRTRCWKKHSLMTHGKKWLFPAQYKIAQSLKLMATSWTIGVRFPTEIRRFFFHQVEPTRDSQFPNHWIPGAKRRKREDHSWSPTRAETWNVAGALSILIDIFCAPSESSEGAARAMSWSVRQSLFPVVLPNLLYYAVSYFISQ
jgi:hypothetical protein